MNTRKATHVVVSGSRSKADSPVTALPDSEYSTKPLSKRTWADFERLFGTHPAPGAYPCWCMHNHRSGSTPKGQGESRNAWIERNRRDKRALVENGRSHGILVYREGEPVGWCQYGRAQELPRIDSNRNYCKAAASARAASWRITCFVVHRKHRHRGVARAALRAALAAIRKHGGGLVEAYPVTSSGAYTQYRGTLSMFEKEGFQVVAPMGANNVLVQRIV